MSMPLHVTGNSFNSGSGSSSFTFVAHSIQSSMGTLANFDGLENDVNHWNQKGINYMNHSRDSEAELCFLKGFRIVETMQPTSELYSLNHRCKSYHCSPNELKLIIPSEKFHAPQTNMEIIPVEDCDTLGYASKRSLAYTTDEMQVYDEGMNCYNEPHPLQTCCCGYGKCVNHNVIKATLLYNAGLSNKRRGLHAQAIRLFEFSLKLLLYTSTHQTTASNILVVEVRHNIGYCYYRQGRNKEAMLSYQLALDEVETSHLPELYRASAQNAVAVLLFHLELQSVPSETSKKCIHLLRMSLRNYETSVGSNCKEAAAVLNNIGRVLAASHEFEAALSLYQEALSIRVQTLGQDSVDVAATTCNIGQTYHKLGEYAKALEHYQHFITLTQKYFGPNHFDVATVLRCIAELYQCQEKLDDAKIFYKKSLSAIKNAVGYNHPEISMILNKLGNLHYEKNELDVALQYYKEGLVVEQTIFDPYHPHIAITLRNMAHVYREQGNFANALVSYSRLHAIRYHVLGANHIDVAHVLADMGLMRYHLGDFQEALDAYSRALLIQRVHYGNDTYNLEISSTISSMGLAAYKNNKRSVALEYFSESLKMRKSILGVDHKDLSPLWNNIATIHLDQGNHEEAIQAYKEALRLDKRAPVKNYADIVWTLQHIGIVYQQQGEWDVALEYFNEAVDRLEAFKCSNRQTIATMWNLIGNINLHKGDVKQMMHSYTCASRILASINGQHPSEQVPGNSFVMCGHTFYGISKLHPPAASMA